MIKIKDDPELEQAFRDWLGWNDQPKPKEDDPDYYTFVWGLQVWVNAARVYMKQEVKICTGCGRLSTDPPIEPPALACCPDSFYLPIRKYWERSCFPSFEYQRKEVSDD